MVKIVCLSSLHKRHLPVLASCMRGAKHWREDMRKHMLPVLQPESAIYSVLVYGMDYEEYARTEAAICVAHLCSCYHSCRRSLLAHGGLADVCHILTKKRQATSTASHFYFQCTVATVLSILTYYGARSVVAWLQGPGSMFVRVEFFVLRMLDILEEIREETLQRGKVFPEAEALVEELLKAIVNIVGRLHVRDWKALIVRYGTEAIVRLLHDPPAVPPRHFEIICMILSSLMVYPDARRRFRAADGLSLFIAKLTGPHLGSAVTAAQTLGRLLELSIEEKDLTHDLIQRGCAAALVALLSRCDDAMGATRDPNAQAECTALAARVVPVMSILMRGMGGNIRDEVLQQNNTLVPVVLSLLRRALSERDRAPHENNVLSLACMQFLSAFIMTSEQGLDVLKALDAQSLYAQCSQEAPSQVHLALALSALTTFQAKSDSSEIQSPGEMLATLQALLKGVAQQDSAARVDSAKGLVRLAASYKYRRLTLIVNFNNAQEKYNNRISENEKNKSCVDELRKKFESYKNMCISVMVATMREFGRSEQAELVEGRRDSARQMRAACATMIYLLATPDEQHLTETDAVAQLLHAGVVQVLHAAIATERGGASLTLGVEATGPGLQACLAATFRLLTDERTRRTMLAEKGEHGYAALRSLAPLIESPNTQVALYAALIIGKLMCDRLAPAACRVCLATSELIPTLLAALEASAQPAHRASDQHRLRRSVLLHVLAALSHMRSVRQVLLRRKSVLRMVVAAVSAAEDVACCLSFQDDLDTHTFISLPCSDFTVRTPGNGADVHYGPFSEAWYENWESGGAPVFNSRRDGMYILFNMATHEFGLGVSVEAILERETARHVHLTEDKWLREGGLDKMLEAVLTAAHDSTECCGSLAFMLMQTLERLLATMHSGMSLKPPIPTANIVLEVIDAITMLGSKIVQVITTEMKAAAMVGSKFSKESNGKRTVVRGSQGLFSLYAGVSALLHVCVSGGGERALVPALRFGHNFVRFVVSALGAIPELGTCGNGLGDVMDTYIETLALPPSVTLVQQHYAGVLRHQEQHGTREVFVSLVAALRAKCAAVVMHLTWACKPKPLLQLGPGYRDNSSQSVGKAPFVQLGTDLTCAIAEGVVPGNLLPLKVLVSSVVAAGAIDVLVVGLAANKAVLTVSPVPFLMYDGSNMGFVSKCGILLS